MVEINDYEWGLTPLPQFVKNKQTLSEVITDPQQIHQIAMLAGECPIVDVTVDLPYVIVKIRPGTLVALYLYYNTETRSFDRERGREHSLKHHYS